MSKMGYIGVSQHFIHQKLGNAGKTLYLLKYLIYVFLKMFYEKKNFVLFFA